MKAQIKLGQIKGIKIGLHYSWLIIAVLISLSLSQYFAEAHPDWGPRITWSMAIATVILFFLAIVLHELSHAAIARSKGLPVRSITLFALGGVAEIEGDTPDAKSEFWLGIIGPITSAVIGLVCLSGAWLLGWEFMSKANTPIMAMLVWLGYVNIALAVFNMIPSFPMDGGRVLKAIVWWITGNPLKATKIASVTGQFMAFSFIVLGLMLFFSGAGFGGLWIAFIGWFVLNAAKATYFKAEFDEGLKTVTVGDLMSRDHIVADGNVSVQTLVDEYLLKTGHRCYMILQNDIPVGMVTPNEIKETQRSIWNFKTASDIMQPIEVLHTVGPEMPAVEAFEIMARENINQLPVLSEGRLLGLISRDKILNYLFTRRELNI